MSHSTKEIKLSEEDKPNTTAIYIIIVLCLAGLAVTFWGLAEYKGYLENKRLNKIQTLEFEQRNQQENAEKPLTELIDKAIEAK